MLMMIIVIVIVTVVISAILLAVWEFCINGFLGGLKIVLSHK